MRYTNIENVEFTNARGETIILKDLRPLVTLSREFEMGNQAGEPLDLIAVKAYKESSEPLWYRIADQNIKEIVSRKFDLSKINVLKIPVK